MTLHELKDLIGKSPETTIVFSDVHGYVELLERAMDELEIRRETPHGKRTVRVGSIGDLIDGRSDGDARTLEFAKQELDFVIAGNHEVALMGGPSFAGQPSSDKQGLGPVLYELAYAGILKAALGASGVLLTHAGVNASYSLQNAELTAELLNKQWEEYLVSPKVRSRMLRQPAALLAPSPLRSGGSLSDLKNQASPGCLWQSWEELLINYPKSFRQIIGHSPRGRIESSQDEVLTNIDVAGYRVGIAVITKGGQIVLGSDFFQI
ncbi:MAG: metallophosphoesterase [Deltaproteobacteria bacterium]|nr:metallophosphoesterase [Deltaproteobacteria bacterium]